MSYEKLTPESPEAHSGSPVDANVAALAELFPSVMQDGQVDFDALRTLLGDAVEPDEHERFGLHWCGKKKARWLAMQPSLGTLRPCREESLNWDTTKNLYIEGDNLEVLKLLRRSYSGRVKMIYIDPPYNTGNDFVYKDDYHDNIENYKKITGQERKYKVNQETDGRYHTEWLNMMYPRLMLARDLLTEDGVLFVSLDDSEIANFRNIADELFGRECLAATLHCQMSTTQGMKVKAAQEGNIVKNAEYVLCYSRNGQKNIAAHLVYDLRPEYDFNYQLYLRKDGTIGKICELYDYRFPKDLSNKNPLKLDEAYRMSNEFASVVRSHLSEIVRSAEADGFSDTNGLQKGFWKKVEKNGREYILTVDNTKTVRQLLKLCDSWGKTDGYNRKEGLRKIRGDWWEGFYRDMVHVNREGNVVFKNGKKPVRLIQQLAHMVTSRGDIVLDFFSGSATTAHAVMKNNLENNLDVRWIMVQLPEKVQKQENDFECATICELGKERIRRAGRKIKEEAGLTRQDLDVGFRVYKLDSSNVQAWNSEVGSGDLPDKKVEGEDLLAKIKRQGKHLVAGRTGEDFLTEIMLKCGIDVLEEIEEREIAGHRVQSLGYGQYYACMDENLAGDAEQVALGVAEWHREEVEAAGIGASDTGCVVFVLDQAFDGQDAAKMNFVEILKQYGISSVKAF